MAPLDFDALKHMHESANDLLHSPVTQHALVNWRDEKWVNVVSEASLTMLDVCGISKDVLLLVKEHLQDLQFMLRRVICISKPDFGVKITAYNHHRKKLKIETLKCLKSLKRMNKNRTTTSIHKPNDHKLVVVLDVLREVRHTTISVLESLFSLISIPWLDGKSAKRSFAWKFMRTGGQSLYDMCDEMELRSANERLEAVGLAIEDIEVELECIFRRLIQTRVLLLNILTN